MVCLRPLFANSLTSAKRIAHREDPYRPKHSANRIAINSLTPTPPISCQVAPRPTYTNSSYCRHKVS